MAKMKKYLNAIFICAISGFYACNASAADFNRLIEICNESRSTGLWADFKLISSKDQKEHPCHKILLASSSTYWSPLLKSGMSETNQGFINLPYSSKSLQIILDVIYRKKFEIKSISLDTYAELLEFASLSFDMTLSKLLDIVPINFSGSEYLSAFNIAVLYDDRHIAEQLFENIQDLEVDIELANSIISYADNNIMIHNLIWSIRSSKLFTFLERTKHAYFGNSQLIFYHDNSAHILNMKNWTKEETEAALLDEHYKLSELELIFLLEKEQISRALALQIDNPEKLASFYTAHLFNLRFFDLWYTAQGTAQDAPCTAPSSFEKAGGGATRIIEGTSLYTAAPAIAKVVRTFISNLYELIPYEISKTYKPANDAIKAAVKAAVAKLDLNCPYEIGKATGRLVYLYALAYIARDELAKSHFYYAYYASLKECENNPYFKSIEKENITAFIAKETWERAKKSKNPHIISLKNIMIIITRPGVREAVK